MVLTPREELNKELLDAEFNLEQASFSSVSHGKYGIKLVHEALTRILAKCNERLAYTIQIVLKELEALLTHADNGWDVISHRLLGLKAALQATRHGFLDLRPAIV